MARCERCLVRVLTIDEEKNPMVIEARTDQGHTRTTIRCCSRCAAAVLAEAGPQKEG
jgi:hypothetical protein